MRVLVETEEIFEKAGSEVISKIQFEYRDTDPDHVIVRIIKEGKLKRNEIETKVIWTDFANAIVAFMNAVEPPKGEEE